ncbi:hypothetical protein TNCV_3881381 [Trichonephila clavipes]|nr:hypothetical protein TNCV_3881381 [Trichonephila clavipes]
MCPPLNIYFNYFHPSRNQIYHYLFLLFPHHHLQPKYISCHPIAATLTEPQPPIPMSNAVFSTTKNMSTPIESSSVISVFPSNSVAEVMTDDDRSGRSATSIINKRVALIGPMILEDRKMRLHDIGNALNIPYGSVSTEAALGPDKPDPYLRRHMDRI